MTGRANASGSLAVRAELGWWPSGRTLLRALRPLQWTKSGVVIAASVFNGALVEAGSLTRAAAVAVLICCASSGTFLDNDLREVAGDRAQPAKRDRPIAAGLVVPTQATLAAAALGALTLGRAWLARPPFLAVSPATSH